MWKKKAGGVSQALNETIEQYDTEHVDVSLEEVRSVSEEFLINSGFNREEAAMTVENLLEAELAGKASHGIIRLPDLRTLQASGDIVTGTEGLEPERAGEDFLFF
jgi:LDH2 family malate/lactate/ureidoglycolate dehydrogenase